MIKLMSECMSDIYILQYAWLWACCILSTHLGFRLFIYLQDSVLSVFSSSSHSRLWSLSSALTEEGWRGLIWFASCQKGQSMNKKQIPCWAETWMLRHFLYNTIHPISLPHQLCGHQCLIILYLGSSDSIKAPWYQQNVPNTFVK